MFYTNRHKLRSLGQQRALSKVLLKITLFLALVLGVLAALVQLSLDLQQQKHAVEESAEAFLDSIIPSAASAVYNFYDEAAEQAVVGLFTQRAIRSVTILNGDDVMVKQTRTLSPTLPNIGLVGQSDEITLTRLLRSPDVGSSEIIGELTIVVDRSVVPPAIVRRMTSFFLLSTIKNLLFGLALVALAYTALTRHILQLANAASQWRPGCGEVTVPSPRNSCATLSLTCWVPRLSRCQARPSWQSVISRVKALKSGRTIPS